MKLVLTQPHLSAAPAADNFAAIRRTLDAASLQLAPEDIVVLPERCDERPGDVYRGEAERLARELGCHLVAGSRHVQRGERRVNAGVVLSPAGELLAEYEKLRPYALERSVVSPGQRLGEVQIAGLRVLV
jgi:predicted amidohydrolase